MAEFEELKLTVSLVDNASAGLRQINAEIDRLGGNVNRMTPQLTKMSEGLTKLSTSARSAGLAMSEVEKRAQTFGKGLGEMASAMGLFANTPAVSALGTMAGAFGGVGLAVTAVVAAATAAALAVRNFAEEMGKLRDRSRDAGVLPEQFKGIADQLTEMTYSSQEAQQELSKFMRTVREAAHVGTAEFNRMYREAAEPDLMLAKVQRFNQLIRSGKPAQALKEAAAEGQRIFDREMARNGDMPEATRQMEAFYQNLGLSNKAQAIKELTDATNASVRTGIRVTDEYSKEWAKLANVFDDVKIEVLNGLTPAFTELAKLLRDLVPIARIVGEVMSVVVNAVIWSIRNQVNAIKTVINGLITAWNALPFTNKVEKLDIQPLGSPLGGGAQDATKKGPAAQPGAGGGAQTGGTGATVGGVWTGGAWPGAGQATTAQPGASVGGGAPAGVGGGAPAGVGGGARPGVPYGNTSGPGTGTGAGQTPADGGAAGVNAGPNAALAADRERFAKEMKDNPELRDKVLRIAHNEQGTNPRGVQGVIESMMNRASYKGTSLAQEAKWTGEGGYYAMGGMGRGALENEKSRAVLEQSLSNVLGGSNVTNYATDNASAALAAKRTANQEMKFTEKIGGESFYQPGRVSGAGNVRKYGDWRERLQRSGGDTQTAARPGADTTAQEPNRGGGDNAPPAAIIERARAVAQLGPRELSNWMAKQGYPQHDQWCGDFAAAVVKSAGGTPPKNWQLASNWRNVGPEVSAAEARPGDIAVARPGWSQRGSGRTGEAGSHVTVFGGFNEGGSFQGIGGNQGRRIGAYDPRRFQFYRPEIAQPAATVAAQQPDYSGITGDEAQRIEPQPYDRTAIRQEVDRQMGTVNVNGQASMDVNVNAPRGSNVNFRGGNLFRKVRMQRNMQMEPASSGPAEAVSGGPGAEELPT